LQQSTLRYGTTTIEPRRLIKADAEMADLPGG